jgi:glycosyltransferase involved in cell wall biosynthesis
MGRMLMSRGHEVTLVAAEGSYLEGATVIEACPAQLGALGRTEAAVKKAVLDTERDVILDITHTHQAAYEDPKHSVIYHQDISAIPRHPRAVFISEDQRYRTYKGKHNARVIINRIIPPHFEDNPLFAGYRVPLDVAIFLGNIVPHKGALVAIEVAKRMGVKLWVAGKVLDGVYGEKVMKACNGVEAIYIGPLNTNEKYRCLSQARMTICAPNTGLNHYHETGQLVVSESAFCGTPVLTSQNGGITDYVFPQIGRSGKNIREMVAQGKAVWEMTDRVSIADFANEHLNLMTHAEEWERILVEAL